MKCIIDPCNVPAIALKLIDVPVKTTDNVPQEEVTFRVWVGFCEGHIDTLNLDITDLVDPADLKREPE